MRIVTGRIGSVLCTLGVSLAVLSGCGGTPGPVDAKLSDYSIALNSSTAKAGDVTFKINNGGAVTHEFVVVQTDLGFSQVPVTAEGKADEEELKGMGEVEDIEAGKSGDLKLNLPAGHYMLICNLPGHFANGMHADFVVTQ